MSTKKSAGKSTEASAASDASGTPIPARRTTPLQDVKSALKTITGEEKRVTKELQKADTSPELQKVQKQQLAGLKTLRGRLEEQMDQIQSKRPKRKGTPAKSTPAKQTKTKSQKQGTD